MWCVAFAFPFEVAYFAWKLSICNLYNRHRKLLQTKYYYFQFLILFFYLLNAFDECFSFL